MQEYLIFTDGGCSGNPGPGGWAYVMYHSGTKEELCGGDSLTTNNKMELTAVIKALERCVELSGTDSRCRVTTNSQYVQKGITLWIHGWKKNGWKTASKEPVKNRELWESLDSLTKTVQVQWAWVKGHAGHPENERCDALVQEAIKTVR